MPDPVLRNWRLIANSVLVGEVSGHPFLNNVWITTSKVVELYEDLVRTGSRRYYLENPLPDDQPLPPAARNAVLPRLLHNSANLAASNLERLSALADELSRWRLGKSHNFPANVIAIFQTVSRSVPLIEAESLTILRPL